MFKNPQTTWIRVCFTVKVWKKILLFFNIWIEGCTTGDIRSKTKHLVPFLTLSVSFWTIISHEMWKIITYNIVILVRSVIKLLDRNFLFIKKVLAFLDLKSVMLIRSTAHPSYCPSAILPIWPTATSDLFSSFCHAYSAVAGRNN